MIEQCDIVNKVILIRINKLYREGMSTNELYEVTRGTWKVGNEKRRNEVEYAMAVYHEIVREVYKIERWHHAGSTPYILRNDEINTRKNNGELVRRYEFTGKEADSGIRTRYIGKSVKKYLKGRGRNPILYINA